MWIQHTLTMKWEGAGLGVVGSAVLLHLCIPKGTSVAQGQGQTGMGQGWGWRLREKALGAFFWASPSFVLCKLGKKTRIQHRLECPGGKWGAG